MSRRFNIPVVWAKAVLLLGCLGGCSDQVDSGQALRLKPGSSPTAARVMLGDGDFQFEMVVGSDQYFGESRYVGYAGQYLFIYRNGAYWKLCEMPLQDMQYRPSWEYLNSRVNQAITAPRVSSIPYEKPPPLDPGKEEFFWNVELPLTVMTLPILPAWLISEQIQYELDRGIRDFYTGRVIQLNQEADTIDRMKYGVPLVIGGYGGGRFIERYRQIEPVAGTTTSMDVMVQNGRVIGVFGVAGNGRVDCSSD